MAEYADREHFIPIRVADLVDYLCDESGPVVGQKLTPDEKTAFREFARAVGGRVHAIYQGELRTLKDAYAPFDPDADPKPLKKLSDAERGVCLERLFDTFVHLMSRANYTRLSPDDLRKTMEGASDWGVDMSVAWDAFDKLEVFYRSKGVGKRTLRSWKKFWRKEERSVQTFRRVVVVLKQKPHRRHDPDTDFNNVFLKLFKDIPTMDVEMLLPATRIKMPKLERFKLGGSATSSIGFVGWKLSSLSLSGFTGALLAGSFWTIYAPLALVLGYGYKTWYSFQVTKQTYTLQLTQSLYYQNLDNNAGVMYRLLDDAEEQETRETLLAYFYLWRYAGDRGWTAEELDDYVELDLEKRLDVKVDFEIRDALLKLEHVGIASATDGRYRALPLAEATAKLTGRA